MLIPYTKDGERLRGTLDMIPGVALITGKDGDGDLIYEGETDVWWDGQTTLSTNKAGEESRSSTPPAGFERVWVSEDGNEVLESEIVWKQD